MSTSSRPRSVAASASACSPVAASRVSYPAVRNSNAVERRMASSSSTCRIRPRAAACGSIKGRTVAACADMVDFRSCVVVSIVHELPRAAPQEIYGWTA
jgi:hypothetical protein